MFQPCPSRRKKTNIVRARTGCRACRQRKRKCDEQKPSCAGCVRRQIPCEASPARFEFRDLTNSVRARAEDSNNRTKEKVLQRCSERQISHCGPFFNVETALGRGLEETSAAANQTAFAVSSDYFEETSVWDNPSEDLHANKLRESTECSNRADQLQTWDADYDRLPMCGEPCLSTDSDRSRAPKPQPTPEAISATTQRVHGLKFQVDVLPLDHTDMSAQNPTPESLQTLGAHHISNDDHPSRWSISSKIESTRENFLREHTSELHDSLSHRVSECKLPETPKPPGQDEELDPLLLEDLYISHFEESMSRIAPLNICRFQPWKIKSGTLKSALLALAAANMAYLHVLSSQQIRRSPSVCSTQSTSPGILSGRISLRLPNLSHLEHSGSYYKAAMRQLRSAMSNREQNKDNANRESLLATSLVLALYERQSGTWRGFQKHLNGAITLANQDSTDFRDSSSAVLLLRMLDHVRCLQRMSLESFRLLDAERSNLPAASGFSSVLSYISYRQQSPLVPNILEIVTHIATIRRRIVMETITASQIRNESGRNTEDAPEELLAWLRTQMGRHYHSDDEREVSFVSLHGDDLYSLLDDQAKDLNEWHRTLKSAELPIERYTSENVQTLRSYNFGNIAAGDILGSLVPLVFQNHEAAMGYIYYTLAQLLCCTAELRRSLSTEEQCSASPSDGNHQDKRNHSEDTKINPWAILSLRIALGIDPTACIQKNIFTLGICEIMLMIGLANPSENLFSYILDVILRRFNAVDAIQEDAMAGIHITKRLVKLLSAEARSGRKVMDVVPSFTEDSEKCELSQEQVPFSAGIFGRLQTGALFRDVITVP